MTQLYNITKNTANKTPYEDSDIIGGTIKEKPDETIRISSMNPCGLRLDEITNQLQHALDLDIDIQCYSEINLDTTKTHLLQQLQEQVTQIDTQARSTWSSSKITTTRNYKPGGTGIITFGGHAGRIKSSGTDALGRWSYQLLDGKGNKEILIMSIYQCCTNPTNKVGIAAYHQQQTQLSMMNRQDTDPRKNFKRDILEFLKAQLNKEGKNTIPLLFGDWNEVLNTNTTPQKICDEFNLIDIWEHCYPNHQNFSTYSRGTKRIDFALTTQETAQHVTAMIYESYKYRMKGDHRAFYVDINIEKLFGSNTHSSPTTSTRGIMSKDRKAVTTYLTHFNNHITRYMN